MALAFCAIVATVTIVLVARTRAAASVDAEQLGEADAVFVVAYHIDRDGTPSARYRDRLARAAELARTTDAEIWCLGGLRRGRDRTNAEDSRRYLETLGVPADRVRVIDEFPFVGDSLETVQESWAALAVASHLGARRIIVLADALQAAQVRLVLSDRVEHLPVLTPSIPSVRTLDDLYYFAVRVPALLVTTIDRDGYSLGWVRVWRSGRWNAWWGGPDQAFAGAPR